MPQELEVKVSKLEGSPAAERGKTVQVFEFIPPQGEDFPEERGQLFAVVEVNLPTERQEVDLTEDAALAAKLVWDTLVGTYYDPSEETALKALEDATETAREKLKDFAEDSDLNLIAVAILGNVAYFSRVGGGALYLRRGAEVRDLAQEEEAVDIGSEILEGDDVLAVGSPVFGKNFTAANLPQTEFLVKQFEQGVKVPGFSALLLMLKPSRESREEAVKNGVSRSPLAKIFKRAKKLPADLPKVKLGALSPSKLGKGVSRFLSDRVSRGKKLAEARKAAPEEREGGEELKALKPPKLKKLPRLPLSRIIAVLVILLVVSIGFTVWRQAQKAKAEEFERIITETTQSLDEAAGLVGLSNERALELVEEARADLERARDIDPRSGEIDPLLSRAEELYNAIEKITPVGEEHIVYDLGLQVEGAQGVAISGSGTTLYVADSTSGSVFSIVIPSGEGELPQVSAIAEGTIQGIREIGSEGGFLYLLSEDKLYRFNLSTKAVDEPVPFERYSLSVSLDTYSGNVYLLVPEEDQIYKFWNLETGYSKAVSWVKAVVDLGYFTDMAVDGDIWLSASGGEIMRLTKGEGTAFAISNLSTPFSSVNKIFTRPNLIRLYILDTGNQRVVVLDKGGNFVRQVKGDGLEGATDLWVSEDEKTLYILVGSKIYRIGL